MSVMGAGNGEALEKYKYGNEHFIELRKVEKVYKTAAGGYRALKNIDVQVDAGEFVAVIGKSGSGKSTLINMVTGIDRPTSGEVLVGDTAVHQLNEDAMARWRGRNLGIVFQFFQLLPTLSVIENVMLPMDFCNLYTPHERQERAMKLLEIVEMTDQAYKLPSAISGGQQQRVAIARALANDPPILIADEPTGNLDSRTADSVFRLFENMIEEGKTIVMVTHDSSLARRASRTVLIADGEVVNEFVARALPMLSQQQMLEVSHKLTAHQYAAGEPILQFDTPNEKFFIITAGQAEIALRRPGGSDVVVARYGPGQYFGEIEALRGGRTIATVRAVPEMPVEVVSLDRETFLALLDQSDETRKAMTQIVQTRMAENVSVRGNKS